MKEGGVEEAPRPSIRSTVRTRSMRHASRLHFLLQRPKLQAAARLGSNRRGQPRAPPPAGGFGVLRRRRIEHQHGQGHGPRSLCEACHEASSRSIEPATVREAGTTTTSSGMAPAAHRYSRRDCTRISFPRPGRRSRRIEMLWTPMSLQPFPSHRIRGARISRSRATE